MNTSITLCKRSSWRCYIGCLPLAVSLIAALAFLARTGYAQSEDFVSLETARKVATFECQRIYGDFQEFDQLTYFDSDDSPSVYVFVFQRGNRFPTQGDLLKHIAKKWQEGDQYVDVIRRHGDGDKSRVTMARQQLGVAYDEIWLAGDFVTIYVSATKTRATIPEERRGLPEAYTHRWLVETIYQGEFKQPSSQQKYYYFGPLDVFFRGSAGTTRLFNVYNGASVSTDSLSSVSYSVSPVEMGEESLERLRMQWSFFTDSLTEDTWEDHLRSPTFAAASLDDLPDFRQDEFYNIMPRGNSCAVMAAGSALGYYDHEGYWNLLDLGYHNGGTSRPQGGFYEYPGFPTSGRDPYSGGVDDMLENIAEAIGYSFTFGYTPRYRIAEGIFDFTNDNTYGNNLDFQIIEAYNPAFTYEVIQNEINSGDPVLVRTTSYEWQRGPGPYGLEGNHMVILLGYDTNMGGGYAEGIYVYLNGRGPRGPVSWDYSDLENVVTWGFNDGGSAGTFLDEPTLQSPADGSVLEEETVDFDWSDVTGANRYWLQVATTPRFNEGVENIETTNSEYTLTLDRGVYFWHVVAQNSNDNWCHFSDAFSFSVEDTTEDFIVTVGEDKVFGGYNYHESWFEDDPNNPLPWPEQREKYSLGNMAQVALVCTPGHAGVAIALAGVDFEWDLAGYSWEEVKDWPAEVGIHFSYRIGANWIEDEGSANAGVNYSGNTSGDWYDLIGYETGQSGWRSNSVTATVRTTVEGLEVWGRHIELHIFCQTHVVGDGTGIHNSCSEVEINRIEIVFPPVRSVEKRLTQGLPTAFELQQNAPNPFNATTAIGYQLPVTSDVELAVYNLLGEKIATLADGEQEAGCRSVNWDASALASSIYFYRLTAGDFTETKRMMLVK